MGFVYCFSFSANVIIQFFPLYWGIKPHNFSTERSLCAFLHLFRYLTSQRPLSPYISVSNELSSSSVHLRTSPSKSSNVPSPSICATCKIILDIAMPTCSQHLLVPHSRIFLVLEPEKRVTWPCHSHKRMHWNDGRTTSSRLSSSHLPIIHNFPLLVKCSNEM